MIKIVPLGAGQDVGRSCIIVSIGDEITGTKNIMFDCGMHMGYNDERRFPDFSYISKSGNFTEMLDCIIISHFHLDHCGALPFFTEMCGYDGPIYMTHPTKAICPILLEDYRRIAVEKKGDTNFFTSQMIKDCMKKVKAVSLHQTIKVNGDEDLEIKAYYAGHVLGAAMFYVRVGQQSVVYTGDYNMTPDRHLGAAWIDKVRPDILITESTYATTIRDSKRSRERDFLSKVHECVARQGKVLIPVFALGRAQELCILLETYWERHDELKNIPIYFSAGMTEKANEYYKLFINWTNEKIKSTFVHRNMFDFKHIKPWERSLIDEVGPRVLFATPGMLHIGTSLEVFKKWAIDEKNMLIMPGYCVAGTVGAKVINNEKRIKIDAQTTIDVQMQVSYMSFSAHADAQGIMQLIKQCEPKNVVLVHGEKAKMEFLLDKINKEFKIPCYSPANGTTITVETSLDIPVDVSVSLLKQQQNMAMQKRIMLSTMSSSTIFNSKKFIDFNRNYIKGLNIENLKPIQSIPIQGLLVMQPNHRLRLIDPKEKITLDDNNNAKLKNHNLSFEIIKKFNLNGKDLRREKIMVDLFETLAKSFDRSLIKIDNENISKIQIRSLSICLFSSVATAAASSSLSQIEKKFVNLEIDLKISWDYKDEDLANKVIPIIENIYQYKIKIDR
ncbi:8096_t:CDS:1 [Ambispora gerdemannii]|uniref:8096_t:CDS:1 n=1 Tax=Ambispora gerdemannii TaxID=144530 RepID=A0A9N8ZP95_9GLOM|nr:8096_t:CDS:1 [Ambispora gerdemannii]